jgi:hypothetical protein
MSSGITGSGGAGGAGGPRGPNGPGDADAPGEAGEATEAGEVRPLDLAAAGPAGPAGSVGPVATDSVDRIAADLDAGRISGREALDRLIDEAVPGELAGADRTELRALMADLIAHDPHLQRLAARIGAGAGGSGGDDG